MSNEEDIVGVVDELTDQIQNAAILLGVEDDVLMARIIRELADRQ